VTGHHCSIADRFDTMMNDTSPSLGGAPAVAMLHLTDWQSYNDVFGTRVRAVSAADALCAAAGAAADRQYCAACNRGRWDAAFRELCAIPNDA
jgi:hypothetical protein